jgi:hypothetical protein
MIVSLAENALPSILEMPSFMGFYPSGFVNGSAHRGMQTFKLARYSGGPTRQRRSLVLA